MAPAGPPQLYFGPYSTPRFRAGRKETCEVRGDVIVVELSSGRIPWPLARLQGKSSRGLLIYKGLDKAIRCESAVAICYWWGVTPQTVSRWRHLMGVDQNTDGSRKLRAEHGNRNWSKVRPKLWAKLHDEEVHEKIAAARRGKPRPPHVIEALRLANTGRRPSAEARAKMRASHLRTRRERPRADQWSAELDAIVLANSATDAARITGRTLRAVYVRRSRLKRGRKA